MPEFRPLDAMPDSSRRAVLRFLARMLTLLPASALAGGAAPALAAGRAEDMTPEEFRRISEALLGRGVDKGFAAAMFAIFRDEPWGLNHLRRLQRKLLDRGGDPRLAWRRLDDGERWFLDHLLTTWITGVYYHQRGNRLVSYEHALMHEILLDVRPVPGLSDREFGFWADRPAPNA